MRLIKDQIARSLRGTRAEEVVKANLENLRGGGVACDMSAKIAVRLIGAHDHHQRIPAHDGRQLFLQRQIARVGPLLLQRYGIAVSRKELLQVPCTAYPERIFQLTNKELRPFGAVLAQNSGKGIQPLASLQRIEVLRPGRNYRARIIHRQGTCTHRSPSFSGFLLNHI